MNVERGRTQEGVKTMMDGLRKVAASTTGGKTQDLSVAGHQAFWGQISATSGSLQVVVGTDVLSLRTYGSGKGAGTLAKTKEIADIVLPRFKQKYPPLKQE